MENIIATTVTGGTAPRDTNTPEINSFFSKEQNTNPISEQIKSDYSGSTVTTSWAYEFEG